ncbi:MAG TPA: preprotein translocase subunit SecG [Acidobacteriota bacterium]|jgi:preprotein translocase subunit SecG|nr:preprotein translocase subunit SecG [Acidobacteriota bacterium]HNR40034.1 preprotein translocase subunit SecG [Acidobacteriota bacterium]HNT99875.1 preprotein translocase subunit SecG [Acidobacteriota bacterium]
MVNLILVIHLICCFILILVILLQSGKSADLAGAFGMMGSQTAFGPRGTATLLSKVTTGAAIIFMVSSLALSFMMSSASGGSSIMDRKSPEKGKPATSAPAKPTPAAPAPASDLQGAQPLDVKVGGGTVQGVQAKPLSQAEVDALLKEQAEKRQQAPASEPKKK